MFNKNSLGITLFVTVKIARRELMLQYFGEANREEIMKNTYTLDEEKEIRENLRLREIEKQ